MARSPTAVWKVVGGEGVGGILVRKGQELTSIAEPMRLQRGALVKELRIAADRINFQLICGTGPPEGWASIRLHDKELMVKEPPEGVALELTRLEQEAKTLAETAKKAAKAFQEARLRAEAADLVEAITDGEDERARMARRIKRVREKNLQERQERRLAFKELDERRALDVLEGSDRERHLEEEKARRERRAQIQEEEAQKRKAEKEEEEAKEAAQKAARAGTAGTCSSEVEARFENLEKLMDSQQSQLKLLQRFCADLLQEVSDLYNSHSALHASHCFLCDCLSGSRILHPDVSSIVMSKKVRQSPLYGRHISHLSTQLDACVSVHMLSPYLGDGGVGITRLSQSARCTLSWREAMASLGMRAMTGDGPLAPSDQAKSPPPNALDEKVWLTIWDYGPSPATLEQWEKSQTVQAVVGSLSGLEGVVGKTDSVRFSDIRAMFAQLGLSLDHFVNKFRYAPGSLSNPVHTLAVMEAITDSILQRFAIQRVDGADRMSCRDLYRMLELIGYPLQRFKSTFPGAAVVQDNPGEGSYLKIGGITIRRQIGQGFKGARCYLGEQSDGTCVALKWPAPMDEVATVKEITRKAHKDALGIPKMLSWGNYQGKSYLVTELLGSPLSSLFERIHAHPVRFRWLALRIIGRMMIRRLMGFHNRGFVHCDISPGNILMGRAQDTIGSSQLALYLIDFELAQKYPGGAKVEGNIGSSEWSSIRSADVVERKPEDDLEALGWVLLNGLVGTLPWFEWLGSAYRDWDSKWIRAQAVKQVQRGKKRVLEDGHTAAAWRRSVGMPEELLAFLRLCHSMADNPAPTDYASLTFLLGGKASLNDQEAEQRDVEAFAKHVMPVL